MTWFTDPRTPAQRRAEIAVPRKPAAYRGKARETKAVYRTHGGALAVPMAYAFGHTVGKKQALTLDGAGLFNRRSASLTRSASAQLVKLGPSLTTASRIRCEGYADHTERRTRKESRALARKRAAKVCAKLASLNPGLRVTVVSYGHGRPAVVGGTSKERGLNRRVVVQASAVRTPAAPTPPSSPQDSIPGAPILHSVEGGDWSVTYAFEAPASDGGSPIAQYQVSTGDDWTPVVAPQQRPVGDSSWIYGVLTDLTPESEVNLRVRALNKNGPGEPSNPLSGSAYGTPSAPLALDVTGGNESLTSTFSAPEHDGGSTILTYEVSYDRGTTWQAHVVTGDAPWTLKKTGLSNGVTYGVEVRATNAFGPGPSASDEGLAATVPGAPTLDAPEVTGTTMTLSFYEPTTDGGTNIISYELTTDGGTTWRPFLFTGGEGWFTATVEDLVYGHQYDVRVRAFNDRGDGAASNAELVTPTTVPGAPTALSATVNSQDVTLEFDAPTFVGGSAITGYEVKVDEGDWVAATVDNNSITLYGQKWGTHVYQVRAVNAAGSSAAVTTDDVEVAKPGPTVYRSEFYYYNDTLWTMVYFWTDPDALSYEARLDGGDWLPVTIDADWGDSAYGTVSDPVCRSGGCTSGRTIQLRAITEDGPQNPGNIFTSTFVQLG